MTEKKLNHLIGNAAEMPMGLDRRGGDDYYRPLIHSLGGMPTAGMLVWGCLAIVAVPVGVSRSDGAVPIWGV